jgi:uncharacterized phiE125 gp8 family phage protein
MERGEMNFELAPFDLDPGYGEAIVSLADMKEHLRVTHDDQDDLIGALRDAAVDMVERYTGVRLGPCAGLQWRAEGLASPVRLGAWPVTGINAIAWLDSEGAVVTGDDGGDWRVGVRDTIMLKPGASLPSGVAAGVVIDFDAGFTDDNRPHALVQAVKMFAAHLFRNADAVITGTISGEVPLGFRALCNAYRMPVI